ncbi:hypothetical protein DYH09_34740 [bacterium CPR1]|nr:hypothetical protein [bacterium CPR1]
MNEPREALVGLVGLAEVAVDAMLRAPWSQKTRLARAEPREWLNSERSSLPNLQAWKGQDFPIGCLPPSSFGPKVKLLRRGSATFDIWAHPTEESAELRAPSPAFDKERLAARVDVECESPPLAGSSNKNWEKRLGNFPQGAWVQLRHALAHLRAPLLSAAALEQVGLASEVFVPRLLEALLRIKEGRPLDWERVDCEEWLTWQSRSPWRREDRSPWTNESTLSDLERWLRLKL